MTTANPYTADMPSITIAGTDFVCHARKVKLIPEDVMADVATFCDPGGEKPGSTKWTCEIDFLLSFGADGSWNLLKAMAKTKVTFIVKPDAAAAAVGNPSATFSAWMPSVPFLDNEIGGSGVFTLAPKVVGQPVFATT